MMSAEQTPIPPSDDPRRAVAAWYLKISSGCMVMPFVFPVTLLIGVLLMRCDAGDPQRNYLESQKAYWALHPTNELPADDSASDYAQAERFCKSGPHTFLSASDSQLMWLQKYKGGVHLEPLATMLRVAARKRVCTKTPFSMQPLFTYSLYATYLARDGKHKEVAEVLSDMYSIARQVKGYQELESAVMVVADNTLSNVLLFHTPTKSSDLTCYKNLLAAERDPRARARRYLLNEKARLLYELDGFAINQPPSWSNPVFARYAPAPNTLSITWYGNERRTCAGIMDDAIGAVDEGRYQIDANASVMKHARGPAPYSMIAPMSDTTFVRYDSLRWVLLRTGIAWLQFRTKYGCDPYELNNLVPEFIPERPKNMRAGAVIGPCGEDAVGFEYSTDELNKTFSNKETVRLSIEDPNDSQVIFKFILFLPPIRNSVKESP